MLTYKSLRQVTAICLAVAAFGSLGVASAQFNVDPNAGWSFPSSTTVTPTPLPIVTASPMPSNTPIITAEPTNNVQPTSQTKSTAKPNQIPEYSGVAVLVGLIIVSLVTVIVLKVRGKKHE